MTTLKERLRKDIDALLENYKSGDYNWRALKWEVREGVRAILQKNGAEDNTPIEITIEEGELIVSVGDINYNLN